MGDLACVDILAPPDDCGMVEVCANAIPDDVVRMSADKIAFFMVIGPTPFKLQSRLTREDEIEMRSKNEYGCHRRGL